MAEQKTLGSNDEDFLIELTKSCRHNYIGTEKEAIMMSRDYFPLRMVIVTPEDEKSEVLASNLPRDLFPHKCFQEIYHMRWQIETAYQTLNDRLQMENFTGTKAILLEQDFNITIYVRIRPKTLYAMLKNINLIICKKIIKHNEDQQEC